MRLQFSIRTLLVLVVVAALASFLYLFGTRIRGEVGLYSFLYVVAPMGTPESRLQKELAHLVICIVGVPGFNSSGRPGDDPYWDIQDYPPILLSCLVAGSVLALIGTVAGVGAWRRRATAGIKSGPTAA